MTSAPSDRARRAVSSPIPALPPITTTVCPISSGSVISTPCATRASRPSSADLAGGCEREKVCEQLRDALRLVVVHPMRRVGQALDMVQVWNVIAIGLGQLGAEVAVVLPPDDE